MATLKSPAMLLYLDNAKNVKGKTNENYARELMELHTLGVDAGLHPAGRAATGADPHRRGHGPTGRRHGRSGAGVHPKAWCATALFAFNPRLPRLQRQDVPRPHHQGQRLRRDRAGGRPDHAASRPAPGSSRDSWPSTSSPTSRHRRWSMRWRRPSSAPMAISPRCCARCSTRPSCFRPSRRQVQGPDPVPGFGDALRVRTASRSANATPLVEVAQRTWASRSSGASRPMAGRWTVPAGPAPGRWPSASTSPANRQRPEPPVRRMPEETGKRRPPRRRGPGSGRAAVPTDAGTLALRRHPGALARPASRRNGTPSCSHRPTSTTAEHRWAIALPHEVMLMNRRQFLLAAASAAAALPALSFSGKLFAAPANAPRFLLVFLRGGYDCNNLLVPYGSDFYYESRPTLAIARPDAGQPGQRHRTWTATGGSTRCCATRSTRCGSASSSPSCRSPAPTTCRAATSKPRTTSSRGAVRRATGAATGRASWHGCQAACQACRPIAFTRSLPLTFQGADRGHSEHLAERRSATHASTAGSRRSSPACTRTRRWPPPRPTAWRCRQTFHEDLRQEMVAGQPRRARARAASPAKPGASPP